MFSNLPGQGDEGTDFYFIDNDDSDEIREDLDKSKETPPWSDRGLRSRLLELSEEAKCCDYLLRERVIVDDWSEAVTGWKAVVACPKYSSKPKRRKNVDSERYKTSIRCVSDDYETSKTSPREDPWWKSNVEPGTYRYIPNNGQYRRGKFSKEERDWFTVKRKIPERVNLSWQSKIGQREIKRQLKKDFGDYMQGHVDEQAEVEHSRSTFSEDNVTSVNSTKQKRQNNALVKSASDLYIENFSSRLTQLNDELKRDYKFGRKIQDTDHPKPNGSKGKSIRESKPTECFCGSSQGNNSGDTGTQDAFIIKPVGRVEKLRPLEKITPQQRVKEDMNKITVARQKYSNPVEDSTKADTLSARNAIAMTNIDLERLRILPLAGKPESSVGHYDANRNVVRNILTRNPDSEKKKSAMKTSSVQPTAVYSREVEFSPNDGGFRSPDTLLNPKGKRSKHIPDPGDLPEISGRRLQVSLTNYRLL